MKIWGREAWSPALGLSLLVPALMVSASFTLEPSAPDSRAAGIAAALSPVPSPGPTSSFDGHSAVVAPDAPSPAAESASVVTRPANSPPLVALQAGHWLAAEVPTELRRLQYNGTLGGGKAEWEVTLEIARRAAAILEERGYAVEILPATVPPRYEADLFLSIHADGFNDPTVSGFTVAAPRRDPTGRASEFVELLAGTYGEATKLRRRMNAPRRMQNYYAFNSRRYDHAIHPNTVAAILETGFLTNPSDRRVIVDAQDLPARGIADAVTRFLPLPANPEPLPIASSAP